MQSSEGHIVRLLTLDGSLLDDPDNGPFDLEYSWSLGGNLIASGETAEVTLTMGENTVTLAVDDGADVDSDTVVVTVINTGQASENLAEEIDALAEDDYLPAGTATSLVASLEAAAESFDEGSVVTGVRQLQAFQNKVEAQSGKKTDAETAAELILLAQDIIDAAVADS